MEPLTAEDLENVRRIAQYWHRPYYSMGFEDFYHEVIVELLSKEGKFTPKAASRAANTCNMRMRRAFNRDKQIIFSKYGVDLTEADDNSHRECYLVHENGEPTSMVVIESDSKTGKLDVSVHPLPEERNEEVQKLLSNLEHDEDTQA